MRVVVLARIEALPGHEADVEALLKWQVSPTLEERGCLNYAVHRDRDNPCVFWLHETWASEADLEAHGRSEHLSRNHERLKAHLAVPSEVHRLSKLG